VYRPVLLTEAGDEVVAVVVVRIHVGYRDERLILDQYRPIEVAARNGEQGDLAAGIAVTGDAVSGADQRGLSAGYFHLPPAVYSEDLDEAERNLKNLLVYEFEVALVYHGNSVTGAASDKLYRYVEVSVSRNRTLRERERSRQLLLVAVGSRFDVLVQPSHVRVATEIGST
jgi:hypothetical protein